MPNNAPLCCLTAADITRLSEVYVRWCDLNCHSERTLQNKRERIGYFVKWLSANGGDALEVETVEAYLWDLRRGEKKRSPETVRTYYATLKAFYRWLQRKRRITADANPFNGEDGVDPPKVPRAEPVPFSPRDALKIEAAAQRRGKGLDRRDAAMFALLMDTGIRTSELIALRVGDIDEGNQLVTIRNGKGGKARVVPIEKEALKTVNDYLDARKTRDDDEYLFVSYRGSKNGGPLSRRGVYKAVSSWCRAAGVNRPMGKIGAHALRHTHGTQYIANGGNALALQRSLGHTTLKQTSQYVAIAEGDASRLHAAVSPYANLKKAQE